MRPSAPPQDRRRSVARHHNQEQTITPSLPAGGLLIGDGLIYVIDLRNGLYMLDYNGPFEKEVDRITFLEGNSNLGHALCFEPVNSTPTYCAN